MTTLGCLLPTVGVLVVGIALTTQLRAAEPESEVLALLHLQQDAWNRHDLEGFMAGYWKSDELTFYSGSNVTRGWQPTLDRYRRHYQAAGTDMGKLEFRDPRVEMLGNDAAFARGEYSLTMPSGKAPHGIFTLILRRFPEGWRIVHDHTSPVE